MKNALEANPPNGPAAGARRLSWLLALTVTAVVGAALFASQSAPASSRGTATLLLPDLNPLEPRQPQVVSSAGHWVLAFGAATDNLGAGPLIIHGSRPSTSAATMTATQTVMRSDGTSVSYPNAGSLIYATEPDHQHWHFLNFMTYELRDVATYSLIRPSQKTGFCLTDDYRSADFDPKNAVPNTPPNAVYSQRCNLNQPDSLTVDEGLSVGWGDYYNPVLEGQSIDLTGVPDGRYYLVVRTNVSHQIHESNYANDGASVQLQLTHPSGPTGEPVVQVLQVCRDGDHCLVPLTLRLAQGARTTRSARTFSVKATLSVAGTVDLSYHVTARILARIHKALPAGTSTIAVPIPRTLKRPATAVVRVVASGPGLKPAAQSLVVRLR
jgi:hypothetical protein